MSKLRTVFGMAGMMSIAFMTETFAQKDGNSGSSIEGRYNELHRLEQATASLPERDQSNEIARTYRNLFSAAVIPESLRQASPQDLGVTLKAAYLAAAYDENKHHFNDMREVFSELEHRNLVTEDQGELMFRALIAYRDFDAARSLLSRYPRLSVEPVPEILISGDGPNGYNVFAVNGDKYALQQATIDISTGTHLIIISHPLCSFSRNAKKDLEADAEFSFAFSPKATWLAPVSGRLDLDEIRNWNQSNPDAQIVIARTKSNWKMIDQWATPQFYAVRDGEIVGHVSGWPKEGRKKDLAALISKLQQDR